MKRIMIVLFFSGLCASVYSMEVEMIPLLKEDYLEKNKKNIMYKTKIPLMHYVMTSLLKDVPKKNKLKIQNKIFTYIDRLYAQDKKIKVVKIGAPVIKREQDWLQKEELRRKMMYCSDRGPAIRRGAAWGGCFGGVLGGNGAGAYYLGDGCVRCCCIKGFTFVSTSLMNKIMCYAVCGGACAGCSIGAVCVATGLSKDIDHYFA